MIKFSQLEKITEGKILNLYQDDDIIELSIDSRKTVGNPNTVFFAIKGIRHDGHDHLDELYKKGIRQFVVEMEWLSPPNDINVMLVKSSIKALQIIASFHRHQFEIPVIGITGSNGKTIIKEWLYQLLSKDFSVIKNPGSYNSQIGVPLSVWQIQNHHTLGIFEAGISKVGEMDSLQKIIDPTVGVFSNIGSAHDEGFSIEENKIIEKLKLFKSVSKLIYCYDHSSIQKALSTAKIPTLSWGNSADADIKISSEKNHFKIKFKDKLFQISLPFSDPASVENAFHCLAVMLHFNIDTQIIQERLQLLKSIAMRLELKRGINNIYLIDDTYNNDLGGLKISLDFLSGQQHKIKKSLILSDIQQSGLAEEELVNKIASLVNVSNIDRFVGVGKSIKRFKDYLKVPSTFYETTEELLNTLSAQNFQDEIILIKGARAFAFESIVNRLQLKVHGTIAEIDLSAMVQNLNFFKSRLKHETKVMVMVKAFAYGSGSSEVANLLQYHKVDYLGVAYADEGIELRKNNISTPIMVMNPSEESFHSIYANKMEPEIYSFGILNSLIQFLNNRSCKIHIKLDTGMHRLGFEEENLQTLIKTLKANPQLEIASIFSHLAGADSIEHDKFSTEQANKFLSLANQISDALGYKPLYHLLNSPGILRLPEFQFDMVRLGIGLYGVNPTAEDVYQLKPAITLKTVISQIKKIKKGETIGYSRKGIANQNMKIATIAIGYADGFNRAFSNGVGEVLVDNQRAKVIGNVCMDMTMIDITGIEAEPGDEVIIFGDQLPIQEVSKKINTIPYEILTNTSERVKRVFVAESI